MDKLNLLCQAIRFQRTALQNSLAMISAVQQHGEKFLQATLQQSPWIPGEGKDVCLFWAGLWTRNLRGVTDLVDRNLAIWEGFSQKDGSSRAAGPVKPPQPAAAVGEASPGREPAVEPQPAGEPPQPAAAVGEASPDREPAVEPQPAAEPPQTAAAAGEASPDREPAVEPQPDGEPPQAAAAVGEASPATESTVESQDAGKAAAAPEEAEQTAMVKIDAQRALVSGQLPEITPKKPQGKPSEKKKARNKNVRDPQKIAKEL